MPTQNQPLITPTTLMPLDKLANMMSKSLNEMDFDKLYQASLEIEKMIQLNQVLLEQVELTTTFTSQPKPSKKVKL